MSKIMIGLGDMHIGNDGAPMPEEVNTEIACSGRNRRHFATPIQKKLLKKWEEMCDAYQKPDILLLNGDIVDGKNYKDSGLGVWTTDIDLQAETAKELIRMLKPRKIIGTTGSPYHSERNPNMDKAAIEKCGGTFHGGYASISIDGCRVFAQHKVSVSKVWQYRTTAIARTLVMATLNEDQFGHYDLVLKSHAHYFVYAGFSSSLGMVLPCWKAYDPFGDANIEFANPAIGYVAFEFDNGALTFDHHTFHFKQSEIKPDVIV